RGQDGPTHLRRLRKVDRDPLDPPVVDPPELRLEALAEGDDGAARMPAEERPDPLVEGPRPQTLPLGPAAALAEALRERVVDAVDELDRQRVLEDAARARRLLRAEVQRPEQGLGDAGEVDRDLAGVAHRSTLVGPPRTRSAAGRAATYRGDAMSSQSAAPVA